MLKQRLIKLVIALALMVAVTGASGIVADELGMSVTPQAFACESPGISDGC